MSRVGRIYAVSVLFLILGIACLKIYTVTKQTIRTRLEWIIASCPRANPSRTTLKRVNELLLTEEHLRR
jgi:tRNA A64-2'-O-ribosylphosphate transferase